MSPQVDLTRRTFLRAVGGMVIATSLAGCTAAEETAAEQPGDSEFVTVEPDYGDWFDDVPNYERTLDWRGQSDVTVRTGTGSDGYEYDPPAILVDANTTVTWEWTGQGGMHTVTHTDGLFESDYLGAEGDTFAYTFSDPGTYKYYCVPHQTMGQKGAIVIE